MGWVPGKDDAIYWHTNMMEYDCDGERGSKIIWERSLLGWVPGRGIIPEPLGEAHRPLWKRADCHSCQYYPCEMGCV